MAPKDDREMVFWIFTAILTFFLCEWSHWISRSRRQRDFPLTTYENLIVFAIPFFAWWLVGSSPRSDAFRNCRQPDSTIYPEICLWLLAPVFLFVVGAVANRYLRRWVARSRGEVDLCGILDADERLEHCAAWVKAKKIMNSFYYLCGFAGHHFGQQRMDVGVREYYARFLAKLDNLKNVKTLDAKTPAWCPPQDYIDLIFFSGLCDYYWEWAVTVSERYTIGGVGSGPTLSMQDLADMAAFEEDLPELKKTIVPGSLSRR